MNILTDTNPTPNLSITNLGGGLYSIRADAIPGRTYNLQFSSDLQSSNWLPLDTAIADENGLLEFFDLAEAQQRFYRTVSP